MVSVLRSASRHRFEPANRNDWKNLHELDQQLLEAFERKEFDRVDDLIKLRDVNVHFGNIGDYPLHYFNDAEIIMKLIECGANAISTNRYKESPLLYACRFSKDKEIIKILLRHGVNVNTKSSLEMTALAYAFDNLGKGIDLETINDLLIYGADMLFKINGVTLFDTGLKHSPEMAKLMIKYFTLPKRTMLRKTNTFLGNEGKERFQYIAAKYPDHLCYYNQCIDETLLLKQEKLYSLDHSRKEKKFKPLFSLYNVCEETLSWIRHNDMMPIPKSYKSKYPIYCDVIQEQLHHVIRKRLNILAKLDTLRVSAEKENGEIVALNADCVRHIAKYLGNRCLEDLIFHSYQTDRESPAKKRKI